MRNWKRVHKDFSENAVFTLVCIFLSGDQYPEQEISLSIFVQESGENFQLSVDELREEYFEVREASRICQDEF